MITSLRRVLIPGVVTFCVASSGCSKTRNETELLVIFDSAGIRVQEIQGRVWSEGARWTVSDEPTLEIGLVEGDSAYAFFRVHSARTLTDGSIAVLDGSSQVRLFDRSGSFVRSIGGAGEGPGEFRDALWLQVLPGDTMLVFDWGLTRISAFTAGGQLIDTETLSDIGSLGFPEGPVDVRMSDGSQVIIFDTFDIVDALRGGTIGMGQLARSTALLLRRRGPGMVDTIVRFPGLESAVVDFEGRGIGSTIFPPLGRMTTHAVGSNRIYVGTQEKFEIVEYALDGTVTGIIRDQNVDLRIDQAAIDHFVEPMMGPNVTPGTREANARYLRETPMPPTRPAYGRILVDDNGNLWISEWFSPVGLPSRWSVFAPEEGLLGDVDFPDRFRVFEIGSDYVLGRWTDDNDVEFVRRYGLNKN